MQFMSTELIPQGLDLDGGGFVSASPPPRASEADAAEQEAWAAQSDKKTSEFLANLTARGGKAIGNAGEGCLHRPMDCLLGLHGTSTVVRA